MKVGELRKQGFKAIAGDTLTNGLSDSIKLSIGGAVAVNEGHHDDLEVVDLLWRTESCDEFIGIMDFEANCWRPYAAKSAGADNKVKFVDNETANATVKAHIESMRPVFTQSMADAGELPQVGSWFTLNYYEHDSRFNDMNGHDFEVIGINDDVYTFRSDTKGFGALRLNPINCQPIDNQTEKQKAVDAAIVEYPVADKETLELAYDLWATKPDKE